MKKSGPPGASRRSRDGNPPLQELRIRGVVNDTAVPVRVLHDPLVDGRWGASCPTWSTIERWEPPFHAGAGSHGTAGGRART